MPDQNTQPFTVADKSLVGSTIEEPKEACVEDQARVKAMAAQYSGADVLDSAAFAAALKTHLGKMQANQAETVLAAVADALAKVPPLHETIAAAVTATLDQTFPNRALKAAGSTRPIA